MNRSAEPELIVGIVAPAGALEALKQLLEALPRGAGMTFLLAQPIGPTHERVSAERIAAWTDMPVLDAEHGAKIEPGAVYVAWPDAELAVRAGTIELSEPAWPGGVRLPADHLFRSLAREHGPRAAGIVLAGAGPDSSDGSAGLRDIRAAGGLTIVLQAQSSSQAGMPGSALDTDIFDVVCEMGEMPAALERFIRLAVPACPEPAAEEPKARTGGALERFSKSDLRRLAALVEADIGFDLGIYKPTTVARRVLRRVALSGLDGPEAYFERLRSDPAEQQALVRDLLISVTDFFRDREAFAALRGLVIEPLVAQAEPGSRLRIWVPGCATGEEVYSIAMEFLDAIEAYRKRVALRIFATDIDQDALAFARAGIYPPSIAEHVPDEQTGRYFKRLDGKGYQVRPPLRDAVSFAVHDLTKDPPFSRMQLVSCRNVLIYLTPEAQQHVLRVTHFALEPDGYLFLSTSETTGPQRELFSTVSKAQRIYRKLGTSPPIAVAHSRKRHTPKLEQRERASGPTAAPRRATGSDLARRAALLACMPPTIVVSDDDTVLYTHGELGPYLRFAEDEGIRSELSALVRPEIANRTRGALYRCRRSGQTIVALSSPGQAEGRRVRITARPAPGLANGAVVLTFETADDGRAPTPTRPDTPEQEAVIEQLEQELAATREDLCTTVEQLETANEELRSSNEESMSMNEELQSTNEELEATTEELRSLNEELTTVNAQLRDKVDQLEQAHDDLDNFFASTKIATVFLDEHLRVKRFTPAARDLLRIDDVDAGRHISDLARELLAHDLEAETKAVLKQLPPQSREIHTSSGRWLVRQVLPYRTESRRIEGAVVTFTDVTDLKQTIEQLRAREGQQAVVAQLGLRALSEPHLQTFMDHAVREVQQTLGTDLCKILELQPGGERMLLRAGIGWRAGIVGTGYVDAGLDSQAGYTLQAAEPVIVTALAEERRFSGPLLLRDHGVVSGLSCVIRDGEHVYGVLGAHTRARRRFTPEDANFLQAVAAVVGSAVGRHQTRTRLAVETGVAHALAEAADIDTAMGAVLECLGSELNAQVTELWRVSEDVLSCHGLHVDAALDRAAVEQQFSGRTFRAGDGLVGHVFERRQAAWCTDLGDRRLFARQDAAEALGLKSGLGFPIKADDDVLAILTAFSKDRLVGDPTLLRSLNGVGRMIGDFIRRVQAEARTRESEIRKSAIINASLDCILTIDGHGRIVELNRAAQQLLGFESHEAVGKEMAALVIPERLRDKHRASLTRVAQGGKPRVIGRRVEMPAMRRDGTEFPVELTIAQVGHGEGVLFTGFIRDITERKRAEDALREADRQKDQFLAMLGHELRNPLAAVRSATELLKATRGNDTGLGRTLAILERQTAHMAKLLDGLLDVSRIVRGKIKLERDVVDFAAVCREVAADAAERAGDRNLELKTAVSQEPIWIEGDRVRLVQIVDNLLSNALKFTSDGGTITTALHEEDGTAVLTVRDTGEGIEPDVLPYIFEVFRQSDQDMSRSRGGLGLGLALVKTLADLHGGTVAAHSKGRGKGAEFVVRLPVTANAPKASASGPAQRNGNPRLLVIEDNEDAAEMLRQLLELAGFEAFFATDAEHGLRLAKAERPAAILCDLGLPNGRTGFDVARQLKSDPAAQHIPLVALSGYGRPEDKERSAKAGFDAHITKPVDMSALERVLAEVSAARGPARRSNDDEQEEIR